MSSYQLVVEVVSRDCEDFGKLRHTQSLPQITRVSHVKGLRVDSSIHEFVSSIVDRDAFMLHYSDIVVNQMIDTRIGVLPVGRYHMDMQVRLIQHA